ncbi:UNVERIFIED_CONTAM: hypothetical protein PYX00_006802 [Menopon gallinae]
METTPDVGLDQAQLRKALEWELSLDGRDLRSHAWYHGAIPRTRAEEIVENDGDFLVRDCTSQPGNYVLTTRCKGQSLHFVINKVVLQPDTVYERVQYQFEEEAYDTVSDLITYYVGSGKAISALSGARIQTPKNRLHPLSFYATKYSLQMNSPLASPLSASGAPRYNNVSSYKSPCQSPPRQKRDVPPKLPNKKQRSYSLTPSEMNGKLQIVNCDDEKSNSADGVIQNMKVNCGKFTTNSLPRGATKVNVAITNGATTVGRNSKMSRVTSDPALSPCFERRKKCHEEESKDPPPKPSRLPSLLPGTEVDVHHHTRIASYQASGSDSGNGSGDSAQSSATGDSNEATTPCGSGAVLRGVVIKNPRYRYETTQLTTSASSTTLKAVEYDPAMEDSLLVALPEKELPSMFDLENFHTLLLPTLENKPVDGSALQCVKNMLRETGSRVLANHLTRVDLEATVGKRDSDEAWRDLGPGITSGIEMCVLPQGRQLRLDIIERAECLKLLVAVTILTCATESERAETLNKWIQVAIDIKTALGNLFGFCSIMLGLCLPQVQRLAATWHILRQKFTDSAFNYEAKLRPTLKSMNECTNPQAPNTTIPHLLPYVLLQERTLEDVLGTSTKFNSSLVTNCLTVFESTSDFGLTTVFAHLEAGRKFASTLPSFRRNAEIVLGDSKVDELLLDMFKTEFHLKFLWGSRGATVSSEERHAKFDQVLTVMSEKCEPSEFGTRV